MRNIVKKLILVNLFAYLSISCSMLPSFPDKHDYFSAPFKCKDTRADLKKEYGGYLKDHQKQRLLVTNLNKNIKKSNIILTGDSISGLYRPVLLKRDMPSLNILNTGIGGDTTDLFLRRLNTDILKYQPRFLFISIGGNDLLRRRCVGQIINNAKKIIVQIHRRSPRTKIFFLSVPPVYKRRLNGIVLFYNLQLQYLIAKQKGVYYLDLWSNLASKEIPGLDPKYYVIYPFGSIDDVHFNEAGYKQMSLIIKKIMSRKGRY